MTKKRDVEAVLAERKKKTAIFDLVPVTDAIMLHYVMNTIYGKFLLEHRLRADWQPNIILSVKKYLGGLPVAQVRIIAGNATQQAEVLFGPVLGNLSGDIRHVTVALAQVVLTLVDQHRYQFTDDALVLQSLGIVNEAVEEGTEDWNYHRQPVRHYYKGFMKRIDASDYFKTEAEHAGVAMEVLH